MKKAVKETPYAESDRKPMSPTESISMEETYNGEQMCIRDRVYAVRLPDASDCIEPRIKCGGGNRNHGGYDAAFRVRAGQYTGDDAAE